MQVVSKDGITIATYADDAVVPMDQFPGARLLPFPGEAEQGINEETPEADLLAYAKQKRWQVEIGGVTVGGLVIATDDRSKTLLMGARISAAADAAFTTPWTFPDGSEEKLDAPTIIATSDAVLAHVAACFDTFSAIKTKLGAKKPTIKTLDDVDAAFAALV